MPINSSNPDNNNEILKEVPNFHEVMNLIAQINVDEEIGNMLDAFYVNDEPELQFFSDIKMIPAQGANMIAIDQQNKAKTVEMSQEYQMTGTETDVGYLDVSKSHQNESTNPHTNKKSNMHKSKKH